MNQMDISTMNGIHPLYCSACLHLYLCIHGTHTTYMPVYGIHGTYTFAVSRTNNVNWSTRSIIYYYHFPATYCMRCTPNNSIPYTTIQSETSKSQTSNTLFMVVIDQQNPTPSLTAPEGHTIIAVGHLYFNPEFHVNLHHTQILIHKVCPTSHTLIIQQEKGSSSSSNALIYFLIWTQEQTNQLLTESSCYTFHETTK